MDRELVSVLAVGGVRMERKEAGQGVAGRLGWWVGWLVACGGLRARAQVSAWPEERTLAPAGAADCKLVPVVSVMEGVAHVRGMRVGVRA